MKRLGMFLSLVLGAHATAVLATDYEDAGPHTPISFYRLATETVDRVNQELTACGLFIVSPFEPGLPYPMTPAIFAVRNNARRLLAYYDEQNYSLENIFVYKNPNGSLPHNIRFNRDNINFVTPYHGTVAHINRYRVAGGYRDDHYCLSRYVGAEQFSECVDREYTQLIARQLCRFPMLTPEVFKY